MCIPPPPTRKILRLSSRAGEVVGNGVRLSYGGIQQTVTGVALNESNYDPSLKTASSWAFLKNTREIKSAQNLEGKIVMEKDLVDCKFDRTKGSKTEKLWSNDGEAIKKMPNDFEWNVKFEERDGTKTYLLKLDVKDYGTLWRRKGARNILKPRVAFGLNSDDEGEGDGYEAAQQAQQLQAAAEDATMSYGEVFFQLLPQTMRDELEAQEWTRDALLRRRFSVVGRGAADYGVDWRARQLLNHLEIYKNCGRKNWVKNRFGGIIAPANFGGEDGDPKVRLLAFTHAGVAASMVYQRRTLGHRIAMLNGGLANAYDGAGVHVTAFSFPDVADDAGLVGGASPSNTNLEDAIVRLRAAMWTVRNLFPSISSLRTQEGDDEEEEEEEEEEEGLDYASLRVGIGPQMDIPFAKAKVSLARQLSTQEWRQVKGALRRTVWRAGNNGLHYVDPHNRLPTTAVDGGERDIGSIVRSGLLDRYQASCRGSRLARGVV